jgi:hypothetical protein
MEYDPDMNYDTLPVVGQEVEVHFSDCCVQGVLRGVVKEVKEDEDDWPETTIRVGDSELHGGFGWKPC